MQPIVIDKMSRFCLVVLALVMAFATFASFYLSLSQLKSIGFALPVPSAIAGALAVAVLWALASSKNRIASIFQQIQRTPHLFEVALALGIAIRVAWWWLTLPEMQVSDGDAYLRLANLIYAGKDYQLGGYAFWPPGTPLVYAAFLFILGQHGWLALAVNLVSFVVCAVSIRAVFSRLGMAPSFAGLSVALLAMWPSLFFAAGQVSKESLVLGLLSGGFALLLSRNAWLSIPSGMVCGLAALTQPVLLFLPLLFGFGIMAMERKSNQTLFRLAAIVLGMALVIAPWTYRNFRIFDDFVPISTNLGFTLHATNQPAMVRAIQDVGEFITPEGPQEPFKNDLAASQWHTAEAIKFIKENPGEFLVLVGHRLTAIMGDDSDSAFRSLRSTRKSTGPAYYIAKALSNFYWVLLTAMLSVFCWNFRDRETWRRAAPVIFVATLMTLYVMSVYGIVEGSGRHHMGWAWIYAVLLTVAVRRSTQTTAVAAQSAVEEFPHLAEENWLRG